MKPKLAANLELPANYYDEKGELTTAAVLYLIRRYRRKETREEILLASSCHDEVGDNKGMSEKS